MGTHTNLIYDVFLSYSSKDKDVVRDIANRLKSVALAGQISREFPVSDHGIDMEIEFKNDAGGATGRRLYLQLKSGDSYLSKRTRDGAEIFKIPKQRHVKYWMEQAYPVMLLNATRKVRSAGWRFAIISSKPPTTAPNRSGRLPSKANASTL